MKKFLIVGSGGRESIFAQRLIEDSILYAFISHKNPTILSCVEQSNGKYTIADVNDPAAVAKFACQHNIDYAFVNADDPLANGVVDELLKNNIKAIGGTKAATRIEWDKIYAMNIMANICPEWTPFHKIVANQEELDKAIHEFQEQDMPLVVKPQGLTGGKGVKVMPQHLASYQDAINYASQLLNDKPTEKVLLVESLDGIEFTIMGLTDGNHLVMTPASYDYPFRLEQDLGPGTGGMGCFTSSDKKLPFITDKDWQDCQHIMMKVIDNIRDRKLLLNGVLNGGFFKTAKGIKFMEFNSRFGDPEALNILTLLRGSFSKILIAMFDKTLNEDKCQFITKASVIKYLVAKEYPDPSSTALRFRVNEQAIEDMGVKIYFASCIKIGNSQYETLKKSRVLALVATAPQVEEAASRIDQAIDKHIDGELEYRRDIGSKENLAKLRL